MQETWETSINELISIFRGAINAILPWLEKAKIPWKEGVAYDDFDVIAESLFESIVAGSVKSQNKYSGKFPKYNYRYTDYSEMDYIGVKDDKGNDLVFVEFQSIFGENDKIKVAVLNKAGFCEKYDSIDYVGDSFFLSKENNGERIVDRDITVLL